MLAVLGPILACFRLYLKALPIASPLLKEKYLFKTLFYASILVINGLFLLVCTDLADVQLLS
jgi:hypothetical protein